MKISRQSGLERRDLLEMEDMLRRNLVDFFSFSGHALYFPTESAPATPKLVPQERRLLLPLARQNRLLGVFMARGVRLREIRPLLPVLPAVAALCLDNLALVKATRTDALTSLATEEAFFADIQQQALRVRAFLDDPAATGNQSAPLHSLCFGLVLLRLCNGKETALRVGYASENALLRKLAQACAADLPEGVQAARVGRHELALVLPVGGRMACHELARAALDRMETVRLPDPLTGRSIRPVLCAGHALYPQDMRGAEMRLPMFEQARRLMSLAGLAADVARDGMAGTGKSRVMPFARILHEGGVVLQSLQGACLRVSLGRRAKAAEGMRFAVYSPEKGRETGRACKGEIVLLQVEESGAVAEILHVADAANMPAPGDGLTLLDPASAPASQPKTHIVLRASDCAHGAKGESLCGYGDFLKRSGFEMERSARFTLVLVRLDRAGSRACAGAFRLWRSLVSGSGGLGGGVAPFGGKYGDNSLILFHSGATPEDVAPVYRRLCECLAQRGLGAAAGVAGYPFLRYTKAETRDCALKALEYALLLPEPKAGVCNSLALNISADRLYSLGDVFGAVEEYKLALLADKTNVMALNSLGVCMAALGRRQDARRHFLAALKRGADGPLAGQTCYNLGAICQSLGERRAAGHYYRRCIAVVPNHSFAHIRLGQMCEERRRPGQAKRFYERAAALEDAQPGNLCPARRLLAGLAVHGRQQGEARELLREALLRNPDDAAAMLALARLYLNGNEDPSLAEMLARRSAALRDCPEAWQTLARAMRVLGREAEAQLAEARAERLP
ncbi:hypothetical protein AGMMS49974_05650 [Deltaproteobacteria bacterium]|nr:hypothetical protein AGMMS49974_05650 [Deltaproteobacteria bacterium]